MRAVLERVFVAVRDDVRRSFREVYEQWRSIFSTVNRWLLLHPTLLIPFAAVYVFVSFIAALAAITIALAVTAAAQWAFGFDSDVFNGLANFLVQVFFVIFLSIVWLHYLYMVIRSLLSAAALRTSALPIFTVAQLVAVLIFIFAAAHYYLAVLSDKPAYNGISQPRPEFGWNGNSIYERLVYIPSLDTVVDFIYFSTVTTATVGYGDIAPLSRPAKLLTVVQIIFSFGLVVVVLGWVIGQVSAKN
jgi:hypothetical protein